MDKKGAKKRFVRWCAAMLAIAVLGACSARKNNARSRFYHSLNSRYNIYFNGKTSFDESLKALNDGLKESYTEQIHMFPVSAQYSGEKQNSGGPFNRAIEKGNKAIKLHSIKEKPKRKSSWQSDPKQVKLQKQEEYNPFMKHCWQLIAEGQYYNGDFLQSAVTFSYIARHFATDEELVAKARIWQARCYTEMDWAYEVNNALKKLKESGMPDQLQNDYDRMYANYLIRSGEKETAIPYLQKSIKAEKNKRQRARQRYLLGQIYQELGQYELAYRTYAKVAASNPPYELEFAARIRETEVFPGGNFNKILSMLRRMAKSDKNKDYLDQVYYAIGNVYMTQQDTAKAIDSYIQGIEKSTQNGLDKAICQIRLGDIYFTQKDYINAQPCFSGALAGIKKEYKDYGRVSRLSATLDELVVHYETVHLQDSLQELARMPEKERLAIIDKIIEQIKEEERKAEEEAKKQEYLATQASIGSNRQMPQMTMPSIPMGSSDNSFYFYNSQTVAQGKNAFQNKWGKRPLEDNWRRRNKKMPLLSDDGEGLAPEQGVEMDEATALAADSLQQVQDSLAADPKSREYYLAQIPLTEDDIESSNIMIVDGLFNMGMIYKDKLEDMNLSVETFKELEHRFPDNKYRLDYYYQIYLMALRYKDTALAEEYGNKLKADFPESDFTTAISDPDYEYNMRMMDIVQDSLYEETYRQYLAEDTAAVRNNYQAIVSKYPLAALMPKFMFLNALTYVQAGNAEGFQAALEELTEKFPNADVSELANEMLKGLLKGRKLMQGHFASMTWDMRFGLDDDMMEADSSLTFSTEQDKPHRMLLIYTTGEIDRNQLLYAVAAYNFSNFQVKGLDISLEEMRTVTIMTISGFNNLKEALDYYEMIYDENGYAAALDGAVTFFPFSDDNYDILMQGKTLEEYMAFFVEHFGDIAPPELVKRWKIRVDEDRKKAEDEVAENDEIDDETGGNILSGKQPAVQNEEVVQSEENEEEIGQSIIDIHQETEEFEEPELPESGETPEEEIERPKAKGVNIFKKLFKKVKEREEFKTLEESLEKIKEAAQDEEQPADSIAGIKPLERVDGELTFEQVQEIRRAQAEEKATQEAEAAVSQEEARKAAETEKKQKAKEREQQRKEKEKASKERQKQRAREHKEKEKEYKERRKQKEKERKEKEKARKAAQKEKAQQRKK